LDYGDLSQVIFKNALQIGPKQICSVPMKRVVPGGSGGDGI
jgi:hypothetical protein